jgi:hypothetical protein
MLRTTFQWLDAHPGIYWGIVALCSLPWLWCIVDARRRAPTTTPSRRNELVFALLTLATLVAWRWPFWLNADPYNPDESQFIAGAITLTRDPVFWRSVDGTTSGPLNFYSLLPLHGLGLPLDFFGARVTGILIVWVAILGCYRLCRSWYGATAARYAVLPLTLFFAIVTQADFLHYSSEHVPLALIALSAWGLFAAHSLERKGWAFLAGGFAAGMLPWAKLQTSPIALVLFVFGVVRIWSDVAIPPPARKPMALRLGLATAVPSLFILAAVGVAGQLGHLYRNYLLQNFSYLDQNWTMASALRQLVKFSFESGHLPGFVVGAIATIVAAALVGKAGRKKSFVAAGICTAVAVVCVLAPKRASLHYTLLAVMPLAIWQGISIGELFRWRAEKHPQRGWGPAFALGATLLILGIRLPQGVPSMFGSFADHWRHPRSAAGNIVRALAKPSDRLAVWGWMDRVYVETGLPQATRESESFEEIAPSRQQGYFRERYVNDLKANRPAVFVDATGPGAPYFTDRGAAGYETVPALAEWVRANYKLVTDLGNARIYATPERLLERPLSDADLWRMTSYARRDPDHRAPLSVAPKRLPKRKLHGRTMQMMLPPAEMIWALDGNEREVFLEYGFDPQAYQQGKSNGAELLVELRPPDGSTRSIFYRWLNPNQEPQDRGNQVSRVILPPFPKGTKLVVRTTPGQFGDNAWDWLYVGALDRVSSPTFAPSQFPNYARRPEFLESEYTAVLEGDDKVLMTHAPTTMQFVLTGNERRWRFDYGFQPGAYTGDNRTDGAVFIVELQRANQSPEVLFSRYLNPLFVEADRGRLHADVPLPATQAGDRLRMRIDPGASIVWDWTYITHLEVDSISP